MPLAIARLRRRSVVVGIVAISLIYVAQLGIANIAVKPESALSQAARGVGVVMIRVMAKTKSRSDPALCFRQSGPAFHFHIGARCVFDRLELTAADRARWHALVESIAALEREGRPWSQDVIARAADRLQARR
jgi:hypothetical protein